MLGLLIESNIYKGNVRNKGKGLAHLIVDGRF